MAYLSNVSIKFADSGSVDAFSRLRVSQPANIFENQFTYNLSSLVFEQITNGSGATITHDATNRMALMTFSSTATGGKAYMQSYEYIPYQAGRSQLVFMTFNFIETKANTLKFAGYSDGVNGIEFQLNGTTKQFTVYSASSNGNETVTQTNWNIDKLDGTGVSGLTLDITKTQILAIDLQALYVGRVRVGFDIDGVIYFVHQFEHSNKVIYPYIQSANLPIRCGMTCSGTVSTTMNFICCSVASEGGDSEIRGRSFTAEGNVTAGNGTRTHILSIRPKTTFNSITNRIKFDLEGIDFLITGSNPILWELCIGQAISGTTTFNDVNTTYSAFQFNTAGTISGSPALVIASGYISATATAKGSTPAKVDQKYPITLDASGAVRSLGTLSLIVTAFTGTSACRTVMNWREIR